MSSIKKIIDDFEEKYKQPFRISRRDEHIEAAEELIKNEKILFAFMGKRTATNNYSVIALTDKRIAVVQSTILGRPLCYSIPWKFVTGIDVYYMSKVFTSGSIKIEHLGGNGSLNLNKISKFAIYEIEDILLTKVEERK